MTSNKVTTKRRSGWVAFALNFIFPPSGYVYAGRTKAGIFSMVCLFAVITAVFFASLAFPPGLFNIVGGISLNATVAILTIGVALGLHAAWLTSRPNISNQSRALFWISLVGLPLCFYGLSLLGRAYWPLPTYVVASDSGLPELAKGDQVAVFGARALCGLQQPKPGTLIVFNKDGASYIKRVIAGAGATVALTQGRLILDGVPVARQVTGSAPIAPSVAHSTTGQIVIETLPNGSSYGTLVAAEFPELHNFGPYKVPPNAWFVLGDNRDNSLDSRNDGAVGQARVCGTVFKIVNSTFRSRIGAELESPPHP